ncbi:MAG: hypothetical protein ACK5Q5_01690 [Planctomycetaceae bacterium]
MRPKLGATRRRDVFVNCPFDDEYLPQFDALLFAILACGFRVRCALEIQDSGEIRLQKILKLIGQCDWGVHDLTRMGLDVDSGLPRFNMPFELGLFLGARHFGNKTQQPKRCLILDEEPYRYQKSLSDIAGQDIQYHGANPLVVIKRVRDWLQTCRSRPDLPGSAAVIQDFKQFLMCVLQESW